MQNLNKPLSEEELDLLDEFLLERIDEEAALQNPDANEGIIMLTELDGFFTAIVSGPEVVLPSQWLPVVWGDYEPEWSSSSEFEAVMSLMTRFMNSIAGTLMTNPQQFEPLFEYREVEGEAFTIVDEWCEGYMMGVALIQDKWEAAGADISALLVPIRAFSKAGDWKGHQYKGKERENLQQAIVTNLRAIHAYWCDRRGESPVSRQPVKREEKIGRNDLCPCGSGKKFKKCCLH